ncbi:response regulator [Mycolicibacterium sp. XJ870]
MSSSTGRSGDEQAIGVLLVDDQELVRLGLRRVLRREEGFVIVGEAGDGADVPAAVARWRPDVVVMDVRMRNVSGIEATQLLTESGGPPVLALTTYDDDELVAGVLRAGARGFVLKHSPAEGLIRAVRTVARGDSYLDSAVTASVLETFRRAPAPIIAEVQPRELTERERDVLIVLARGLTNGEIAEMLGISDTTVKTHVRRIFAKLDLRDRPAAIVYAYEHGIVTATSPDDTYRRGGSSASM